MTTLQEAARKAIKALEVATTPLAKDRQEVLTAMYDLRTALAQQGEPVAWAIYDKRGGSKSIHWAEQNIGVHAEMYEAVPLYRAAPAPQAQEPTAWRTEALKWIRRKAEDQRATNEQNPRHAEAYPSWGERVRNWHWLADELELEQNSTSFGLEPYQEPAPQPAQDALQDIAAYIGVGGYNGATTEQLSERIRVEFDRLAALQSAQPVAPNHCEHALDMVVRELTDEGILEKAHRICWRYKHSSDPHHSDTYTFNKATMLDFVRAIEKARRE